MTEDVKTENPAGDGKGAEQENDDGPEEQIAALAGSPVVTVQGKLRGARAGFEFSSFGFGHKRIDSVGS